MITNSSVRLVEDKRIFYRPVNTYTACTLIANVPYRSHTRSMLCNKCSFECCMYVSVGPLYNLVYKFSIYQNIIPSISIVFEEIIYAETNRKKRENKKQNP